MTDTHAHLYWADFDRDRNEVIQRCRDKLAAVINVGVDIQTSRAVIELADRHDFMYAAVGIHPEGALAAAGSSNALSTLTTLIAQTSRVVAVGEVGVDYHTNLDDEDKRNQQKLFQEQIELALEYGLPIIIHSRDAFDDTYQILKDYRGRDRFRGVWHSFTEGPNRTQKVLDLGLYIGINGIVTYPSAPDLRAAVQEISLERILLETDAPFLVPQPLRGRVKRNEPWMVEHVADEVAQIKDVALEEVIAATDRSARSLFGMAGEPCTHRAMALPLGTIGDQAGLGCPSVLD